MPFIELPIISDESEAVNQLINVASIGRVYPNPQTNRKCIVELNYQSVNDAPVFLEVELAFDSVKALITSSQRS